MAPIATVAGFNLTPVKSTALQHPQTIDLRVDGAVGDRRFVFARDDGSRLHGISKAPLMPIISTWDRDRERLRLRVPQGTEVEGDARPTGPPTAIDLYDRPVMGQLVDPAFAEAVHEVDPTLALFRIVEPEYAGGGHRASIVSLASVAEVARTGGGDELDPRRFRMLVELDGLDPFEEDTWSGAVVRVGAATLRFGGRVPRCVMTTLHPDTGVQDVDTLAMLAVDRSIDGKLRLGVYGDVLEPGVIGLGDPVEVLATV